MIFYSGSMKLINNRGSTQDQQLQKKKAIESMTSKGEQRYTKNYFSNLSKLKAVIKDKNDQKLRDLLEFLQKEYPEGEKKFNLGSLYQIPIQAKGVELLMSYIYWNIEMLNLTMHKIQNQGLQNIINRNLPQSENNRGGTRQVWTNLSELSLIKNNLTSEGFQKFENMQLKNFKILRANNNNIDHVAIYKFIQADWPQFQELDLSNNKIGKEGCKLLMMSKWKKFRKLDLNYNSIENQGIHYLTEADWPELISLNISNNKIDATGTFYIKKANWPNLRELIMNRNQVGTQKGRYTLVGCVNLCKIKSNFLNKLSLYGNQITLNAIQVLLPSPKLSPGCFLELSRNHFKFEDIKQSLKNLNRFCNQFEN